MQTLNHLTLIGLVVLVIGIFLITVGLYYRGLETQEQPSSRVESKGIILVGPIPIIWGFGKKGKIVAVLAIIVMVLFIVLWPF